MAPQGRHTSLQLSAEPPPPPTPAPPVLDDTGASATAQLRLLLVQRFAMQAAVSLFPAADAGPAGADAVAAAAAAVAGNATLQRQLATAVNASLLAALLPQQLNLTSTVTAGAAAASVTAVPGSTASVAAMEAVQALAAELRRRRMAQAASPPPPPPPDGPKPALQLTFALDAISASPLLYAGTTPPSLPAGAAGQLALQPVDGVFAAALQQAAAAVCAALADVLRANPATAAALQSAGGAFSCSPPAAVSAVVASTPAVDFDAFSWLPGGRHAALRCAKLSWAAPSAPSTGCLTACPSSAHACGLCIACSLAAVLGALSAARQQLQALRASLAAAGTLADSGQHLAGISAAWEKFVGAYSGSQVGGPRRGMGHACAALGQLHAPRGQCEPPPCPPALIRDPRTNPPTSAGCPGRPPSAGGVPADRRPPAGPARHRGRRRRAAARRAGAGVPRRHQPVQARLAAQQLRDASALRVLAASVQGCAAVQRQAAAVCPSAMSPACHPFPLLQRRAADRPGQPEPVLPGARRRRGRQPPGLLRRHARQRRLRRGQRCGGGGRRRRQPAAVHRWADEGVAGGAAAAAAAAQALHVWHGGPCRPMRGPIIQAAHTRCTFASPPPRRQPGHQRDGGRPLPAPAPRRGGCQRRRRRRRRRRG